MPPYKKSVLSGLATLSFVALALAGEGVPPEEWTPQEQKMVLQMRATYEKQGLPFTDEQASISVETMRERIARMTGQVAAWQSAGPAAIAGTAAVSNVQPQAPSLTEEDLGARYAGIPAKTGDVKIEGRRDGFIVNGQPFVDPEGPIAGYAFDAVSGNIGYVIQSGDGDIIKVTRAGASAEPLKIASARQSNAGWQVLTATGRTIAGSRYSVTPSGLLVSRPTAAFLYQPGKGVSNFAVPEGYLLAELQRGDVGSTAHVLLEKDLTNAQRGPLGSLKELGSIFGAGKLQQYALIDLATGRLHALDIPVSGKKVTAASGCQRQNDFVNKCSTATRFESLYDTNGTRNDGHYYWRVAWLNTPAGPLAVSLEGSLTTLYVTDLRTGKKAVAFHRAMGINGFEVDQKPDGTVGIKARLGFSTEELADAVAFLQASNDVQASDQKTQ